jgi:branched-chain amino acid transport system ATP-binding protein
VLAVDNLEVVYEDVILVLKGISLRVPDGAIVALLGANGAGKTTVLRAITGLLDVHRGEITKGSVTLDGHVLNGLDAPGTVSKGIAQVMEGRRIFAEMSVEDNLRMGENGKSGDRGWNYDSVCDLFPILRERAGQLAPTLSGGQQQMVAIGRALISNPRVLLCDEVSLGLSPAAVKDVYAAIAKIKERGTTIVIVEQDLNTALSSADRVYCFLEGKVSLAGRADEFDRAQILAAYFGNQ